jgi:hypothetical protein
MRFKSSLSWNEELDCFFNVVCDNPSSLGEDASGELYVCDITNGNIYKIIPAR